MRTAVFALLGLSVLLVGFILRLVASQLHYYAWAILFLGAALLAVTTIADFKRLGAALVSRRGRSNASAMVRASLLGGVILLANAISAGTYHQFDFSSLSAFTLSDQTKAVLTKLREPVQIANFFTPSVPATVSNYARNLEGEYRSYSKLLTVSNFDPTLDPEAAAAYHIGQYGALYGVTVFKGRYGERQVYGPQINAEAEQAFTSAIMEVTGQRQKEIYFLVGQGERDIYSVYNAARTMLAGNLYDVKQLDLLTTSGIPKQAAVVVVAGPRRSISSSGLKVLEQYLRNGGRMLLLLDPGAPVGFRALLSDWGLKFENGTLIDPSSYVVPDKTTPLVPRIRNHFGIGRTYFPDAAAVIPEPNLPSNLNVAPLAWTSRSSWLDTAYSPGIDPIFSKKTGVKGPLAIGALVSSTRGNPRAPSGGTRLAVIANSAFASNRHIQGGNNGELLLSTINWLAEGKTIIPIRHKVLPARRLILSAPQARFLLLSSIALFPLLLLFAAGYAWWRRR